MSPKLPKVVSVIYNNIIFKLLIVLLIIFLSVHDRQLAIMVTAVYLLTVHRLNSIEYFTPKPIGDYPVPVSNPSGGTQSGGGSTVNPGATSNTRSGATSNTRSGAQQSR
jgi:hypothetical protein